LPVLVTASVGAGIAVTLAVTSAVRTHAGGLWPIVVGTSVILLYAAYAWTTRRLS
jgi:hypothetical protein